FIVTNPNCSTVMIALALAPLAARFGIEAVAVTTLQAISGAGYPGVASLDITDNVVPFIANEEEKIERETRKILGRLDGGRVEPAPFVVSAQCHRVNVVDGHMAAVRVRLQRDADVPELREAFVAFTALPQQLRLPTAPERPGRPTAWCGRAGATRALPAGAGPRAATGRAGGAGGGGVASSLARSGGTVEGGVMMKRLVFLSLIRLVALCALVLLSARPPV